MYYTESELKGLIEENVRLKYRVECLERELESLGETADRYREQYEDFCKRFTTAHAEEVPETAEIEVMLSLPKFMSEKDIRVGYFELMKQLVIKR